MSSLPTSTSRTILYSIWKCVLATFVHIMMTIGQDRCFAAIVNVLMTHGTWNFSRLNNALKTKNEVVLIEIFAKQNDRGVICVHKSLEKRLIQFYFHPLNSPIVRQKNVNRKERLGVMYTNVKF